MAARMVQQDRAYAVAGIRQAEASALIGKRGISLDRVHPLKSEHARFPAPEGSSPPQRPSSAAGSGKYCEPVLGHSTLKFGHLAVLQRCLRPKSTDSRTVQV